MVGAFTALTMAVGATQANAATLVDNLSVGAQTGQYSQFGTNTGQDSDWLAQAFATTATDYILTSVSAIIGRSSGANSGTFTFSIYDDSGASGAPGTLIADIFTGNITTLSPTGGTVAATALPLSLAPSTNYYLVLHTTGAPDYLDWYFGPNGSGTGFPTNFVAGSIVTPPNVSWGTPDNTGNDQLMQILAEGPPPPVPGPLPIFGAAAAFGYSRRIRVRVARSR